VWANFAFLEDTLFELQKVGNELVATCGDGRGRTADSFSAG